MPSFTATLTATEDKPLGLKIDIYYQIIEILNDALPSNIKVGMYITHANGPAVTLQNARGDFSKKIKSIVKSDGSIDLTFSFKAAPEIATKIKELKALVNKRVSVQWKEEGTNKLEWYEGTIISYDEKKITDTITSYDGAEFKVKYDDGDVRSYDFSTRDPTTFKILDASPEKKTNWFEK